MPEPLLLCVLPPGRLSAVEEIRAAGFTPVADLARGWEGPVPPGAWVRARADGPVPGTGPVVLLDSDAPVAGRATWMERPGPGEVPAGFAGVVLLGGDPAGMTGRFIEAVTSPEEASQAIARGAMGILVPEPGTARRLAAFADAALAGHAARAVQPELTALLRAALSATRPEPPAVVCAGLALGVEGGRDPFDGDAPDRASLAAKGSLGVAMLAGAGREALAAAGIPLLREGKGSLILPPALRRATGLLAPGAVGGLARALGAEGPLLALPDGPVGLVGAVTVAECWLRAGRATRLLILAAEGGAAVALLLESAREARARGWAPVGRLLTARLGTHVDGVREAAAEATGTPLREARVVGAREGAGAQALEAELGGRPRAAGGDLRGVVSDALALLTLVSRAGEEPARLVFRLAEGAEGAQGVLAWAREGGGPPGVADEHVWTTWAEALAHGLMPRREGRLWVLAPPVAARPEAPPMGEDVADTPTARSDTQVEAVARRAARDRSLRQRLLIELIEESARRTGLSPGEIEPETQLGADLSLSVEERAEIVEELCERYHLPADLDDEVIGDVSLDRLVAALHSRLEAQRSARDEEESSSTVVLPTPAPATGLPRIPTASEQSADGPTRGLRPELPANLRLRRPVLVERALVGEGLLRGRVVRVLGTGALAEALREAVEGRGGRLAGDPDAVIDATDDVLESFDGARGLGEKPPRDWLCITRLGAVPGKAGLDRAAAEGARAGFARALRREWEGVVARVLDLDPGIGPDAAVALVCEELAAGDAAVDVYHDDARRKVLEHGLEDFPPRAGAIAGRGAVILAGGTQGIAARLGVELAKRGAVRIAVLARTPPARRPFDEAAARAAVERAIRARGRRPSDSRVSRGLEPYRDAEDARINLGKMRDAGADVRFFKVDLGDPLAVAEAVEEVRQAFGSVDGALIAVGADEARPVVAHDTQSWRKDFEPLAMGGLALARSLPPEAWLVAVGDLDGRFGAVGHSADGAASEALVRACLARPRALFLALDTLAGETRPEAVEGEIAEAVTVEGASSLLVDLIAAGSEGELVAAARLGERRLASPHPLLDGLDWDGDAVIAWRDASFDSDPWLADYVLDGAPQLPLSVGLELMVATARALRPGARFTGVRGVQQETPCKLSRHEPVRLFVRAELAPDGEVRCSLSAERALRPGRLVRTEHLTAQLSTRASRGPDPLPPAFFPEETIGRGQVYRRFFHGTVFQVLGEIGAMASNGLLADATVDHVMLAGGLVSAPLAMEAAFQAAGLHRLALEATIALPRSLAQLWLASVPSDGTTLDLMVRCTGESYDVDVDGPDGPVLRVRGLTLDDRLALSPADRIPLPEGGWPAAVVGRADQR